jgi:hypothetical protein
MTNAKTLVLVCEGNSVTSPRLPFLTFGEAKKIADSLKGEIVEKSKSEFVATFNAVEHRDSYCVRLMSAYNSNRKVGSAPMEIRIVESTTQTKTKTAKKPTASKGKTTSSTKKTEAKKTETPKKTKSSSKKATATKKSTTSTKPPKKAKSFAFGKIKGETVSEKNSALHKELVKMGLKDSRSDAYQDIWNARPWMSKK